MVQTNDTTATKKPNFNKANIKKAIAHGRKLIKSGKSKADTSREIYNPLRMKIGKSFSMCSNKEPV